MDPGDVDQPVVDRCERVNNPATKVFTITYDQPARRYRVADDLPINQDLKGILLVAESDSFKKRSDREA